MKKDFLSAGLTAQLSLLFITKRPVSLKHPGRSLLR
ncbi:hypothetical protein J2T02_004120 [Chitinophaga terrae (ex Kim and Jung 2007)]|nr:hypothetical protein [Chitinophaga terrae (ex Kim and Jung 2007)]